MQPFYGFKTEIAMFIEYSELVTLDWIHSLKKHGKKLKSHILIYISTKASAHLLFSSIKNDEHFLERYALDSQLDPITSTCTKFIIKSKNQKDSVKVSVATTKKAMLMLFHELEFFKNEYLDNDQILYLTSQERDKLIIKAKQWNLLINSFLNTQTFEFKDMYQIEILEPKDINQEITATIYQMKQYLAKA